MSVLQEQARPELGSRSVPAADRLRLFLMLNSFETGGTERQFVSLATSLDAERFSLNIGCIQTKGPLREVFGEVPRFKLGGSVYGWKSWHSRFQLARHLRQQKIQVAHAFDFYTNLTLPPAAIAARVPVIIGSQRQLGDLLTPAQRKLQLAAFRLCDAIVCNSRAAADKLIEDGVADSKIRIIGNALASEAFAAAQALLPKIPESLRVGMIARMNTRSKNHSIFLKAAAIIARRFPQTEFVLAGDGPLRPDLEAEAAELGLGNRVIFIGDRRDIPAVMASLDLTVVPSESESLSNVILESMAAGIPVVATNVGGNPELVNHDRGILVPVRDVDGIVSAAAQILSDAEYRRALGANAKQFAHERFSMESITREYEQFYQDLLEKKTRGKSAKRSTSRGIRVAVVGPSLNYVGGQSVQLDLLLKHWAGSEEIAAHFVPVDPNFPRGLRWVARVPGLRTIVRTPFYFAGLWSGLRDTDVAHIFSASYSSFLLAPLPAWVVAQFRGCKTLIHYHSGEARDHLRGSRIARFVLGRTDAIVVPSGYLIDVFREFGLPAKAVPNIVDLSQFCYREREPLRPHLVCTRGFHPYYSIDVVVRAFALVRREFPDAVLDLVGRGPLEADIRNLVSELKLEGVNFCGVASRSEIGGFYDRADIFINASRLDNMPVSVLEAFASGTPVISTAPEGMSYLVEHNRTGLLSEPGDSGALAQNVIRVLRDAHLSRALIRNAKEEMARYEWKQVRAQWLHTYGGLVKS